MNLNNFALVKDHVQKRLYKDQQDVNYSLERYVSTLNLEAKKDVSYRIKILYEELLKVKHEIDTFEVQEFVLLAEHPEILVKIIYHRLIFFEDNQCHSLAEATLLNKKLNYLNDQLKTEKSKLPLFTWDDFMDGKENAVFYQLKQKPPLTPPKEYRKMRMWQTEQLLKIVSLEANHFIKTFQENIDPDSSIMEQLDQEVTNLQSIFNTEGTRSCETLTSKLYQIKALKNSLIPINQEAFHKAIVRFQEGQIDYDLFSPPNLNELIQRYQNNTKSCELSTPPILGYSLTWYGDWLDDVRNGNKNLKSGLLIDYDILFQTALQQAKIQAANDKQNIEQKLKALTPEESPKKVIIEELDRLRFYLREINSTKYFELIGEDEQIKLEFLNNCLFSGDPQTQQKILKQALVVELDLCTYLDKLLNQYWDPWLKKILAPPLQVGSKIIESINSMVPDSETIVRMIQLNADFIGDLRKEGKPPVFISRDLHEGLLELFDLTERRCEEHISRLDDSTIYEYTKFTIRELRSKCQEYKKTDDSVTSKLENFQQLIQREFEMIKTVAKPINLEKLLKKGPPKPKAFTFGYKKSTPRYLETIVKALVESPRIKMLDERTDSQDLIELLAAPDIAKIPMVQLYITCKTTQFRYIITKFKTLLPKFNPTNIEKCGRFYSTSGDPFTANNLNPSKSGYPKGGQEIDRIFSQG